MLGAREDAQLRASNNTSGRLHSHCASASTNHQQVIIRKLPKMFNPGNPSRRSARTNATGNTSTKRHVSAQQTASTTILRSGRPHHAHTHNTAALNSSQLLGLPVEMRDQIFSHLLPHELHVETRFNRSNPKLPGASFLIKDCEEQVACTAMLKVSKETRYIMSLLLEKHVKDVTLVLDMSSHSPRDTRMKCMDLTFLDRINHVKISNYYGIRHGQILPQMEIYTALQRFTLTLARRQHGDTSQEFSWTSALWHHHVPDDELTPYVQDSAVLTEHLESFIKHRLHSYRRVYDPHSEEAPTEADDHFVGGDLLTIQNALDFGIEVVWYDSPATPKPTIAWYASREETREKLRSVKKKGKVEDWKANGGEKDTLTDKLLKDSNTMLYAAGLEIPGEISGTMV